MPPFLIEHWPKLVAAILVPVILGAIALMIAKSERKEERVEGQHVERGRQEVIIETDRKVIENVKRAEDAVRQPDAAAVGGVRGKYDRCANRGCE